MLPTRLNLLLPEKRAYLRRMVSVQFMKSTLEILLISLCATAVLLLGGRWLLQNHFQDLAGHVASLSNRHGTTNRAIKTVNIRLREFDKIQKKHILWTPVLSDITNAIPAGVVLSNLTLDLSAKTFSFSGTAGTRDDLLTLQESLEALPFIEEAKVPLSQLTTKEKVSFSIKATVTNL